MKPRVLFVSRRVELPLAPSLARKWDAIGEEIDFRVLAGGSGGNGVFRLARELPVLDGPAFFAALPLRVARELRAFRPHAVLAQGAHETAAALSARRLARTNTAVIADLHGDWRAPTRLYGSRLRGALNPVADRVALAALRNADGIRTVTGYTTGLVRELGLEPADEFPAYMDFDSFLQAAPVNLPERPAALFVGVLERYKNVDGLAEAWRRAAPQVPQARLRLVGSGTMRPLVEELVGELPEQTSWTERLTQSRGVVGARRVDAPRPSVPLRRNGPRDRGSLLPWPSARCQPRRRHPGSRGGRCQRAAGRAGRHGGARGRTRSAAHRPCAGGAPGAGAQASAGEWTISPEEFASRLRALVERTAGLS